MIRVACDNDAASCLIASVIAETETPCPCEGGPLRICGAGPDGQHVEVRKASRDRMKRKLHKFGVMYEHGAITREEIAESYQSWRSHAMHGDCRQLVAKFDSIYKTTIERSKDTCPKH